MNFKKIITIILLLLTFGITSLEVKAESGNELFVMPDDLFYGYINKDGDFIIKPQFLAATEFSDGLACVLSGSISIDENVIISKFQKHTLEMLEPIINKKFKSLGEVKTALKSLSLNDEEIDRLLFPSTLEGETSGIILNFEGWGFIDKTGEFVIEPQFDGKGSFSEGLAAIPVKNYDSYWEREGILWGYIDKTGEFVIEPQFEVARSFSEGVAPVKLDDKYGYIDKTGNMVIKLEFGCAWSFREGLGCVVADKYGFIDNTGKFLIKPQFYYVLDFSEGLAPVCFKKNGLEFWGYIDTTGQIIIEPQFRAVGYFKEGLARVGFESYSDYIFGYINKSGEFVANPQFQVAGYFSEGLAFVCPYPKNKCREILGSNHYDELFDKEYNYKDEYCYSYYFIDNRGNIVIDVTSLINEIFIEDIYPRPVNLSRYHFSSGYCDIHFSGELAAVCVEVGYRYDFLVYINKNGQVVCYHKIPSYSSKIE